MTIIEVVRSGKRLKRAGWATFRCYPWENICLLERDILADDWEVEPEPEPKLEPREFSVYAHPSPNGYCQQEHRCAKWDHTLVRCREIIE